MNWSNHKNVSIRSMPHLQFGQLDKLRADVIIDESAKAIKPRIQESRQSKKVALV